MSRIYLPATCNILVPGHILLMEKLAYEGELYVGLLTAEALKGYKKERMKYKDREFILQSLDIPMLIVPQYTLDPTDNIKLLNIDTLATGDTFEDVERAAIKKLKLNKIIIKSGHKLHSSQI